MPKMPVVSVIMTVYNGERYLEEAIESIRQQTLSDFEFVIVDDGSTDHTSAILQKTQSDSRIKVLTKPHLGRSRALNLAWRQSRGKYIANLDADDLAEPRRLEKQLTFLQEHPGVGMLSTDCKFLYQERGKEVLEQLPPADAQLRRELVRHCPIVHSSVMLPRHVLDEVGGYDETLHVAVDYDLWVRIAGRYQLANLQEPLTMRRMHSHRYFQRQIPVWQRIKTVTWIRWRAWRMFSRDVTELPYVFLEPVAKSLKGGLRSRQLLRTSSR